MRARKGFGCCVVVTRTDAKRMMEGCSCYDGTMAERVVVVSGNGVSRLGFMRWLELFDGGLVWIRHFGSEADRSRRDREASRGEAVLTWGLVVLLLKEGVCGSDGIIVGGWRWKEE